MFDFLFDMNNYNERKVARFVEGSTIVDTCRVSDSTQPFETAIEHPRYNGGKWIVVEQYNTKEEAEAGHDKWVKIMTGELPGVLKDVSECGMAKLQDILSDDWRKCKMTM
jgi:hypothetical protein